MIKMTAEEPNWEVINQRKKIDIVKGQTANMAWNLSLQLLETDEVGKDGLIDYYEKFFPKLLEVNLKLLNGNHADTGPRVIANVPAGSNYTTESKAYNKKASDPKMQEIGAAWIDKRFKDKLSCKNTETGEWASVKLSELKDGKYESSNGTWLFKKIENRTNEKMPLYRIYKEDA